MARAWVVTAAEKENAHGPHGSERSWSLTNVKSTDPPQFAKGAPGLGCIVDSVCRAVVQTKPLPMTQASPFAGAGVWSGGGGCVGNGAAASPVVASAVGRVVADGMATVVVPGGVVADGPVVGVDEQP